MNETTAAVAEESSSDVAMLKQQIQELTTQLDWIKACLVANFPDAAAKLEKYSRP
jgi:hypothetical protein